MRIIIHAENAGEDLALRRTATVLPDYRKHHPDKGQRITVRFDTEGALIMYHDKKDVVLFEWESK